MPTTIADAVSQYRTGLLNAATTAINDTDVMIIHGRPDVDQPDDIVSIGVPSAGIDVATMTPSRTREMMLTCPVFFSIYRNGGPEQEETITTRAFDLFSKLEKRVRVDDTTLGGVVRWCLCTAFTDDESGLIQTASGRLLEMTATFTAPVRLTNG